MLKFVSCPDRGCNYCQGDQQLTLHSVTSDQGELSLARRPVAGGDACPVPAKALGMSALRRGGGRQGTLGRGGVSVSCWPHQNWDVVGIADLDDQE